MVTNNFTRLNMLDLYEWAMFYLQQWDAISIPLNKGETPAVVWDQFQDKPPRLVDYELWFVDAHPWGIALICGEQLSRLVSLNFSDPSDYHSLRHVLPSNALVINSQNEGKTKISVILRNAYSMTNISEGTFKHYPKLSISGTNSFVIVPPTPGYSWRIIFEALPTLDVGQWLTDTVVRSKH